MELAIAVGQLLIGGFDGTTLPRSFAAALSEGRVGGATLFRRNIAKGEEGLERVAALNAEIREASPAELPPPVIAVDQEGGRVARLSSPALVLPPMRVLGRRGDVELLRRAARAQARELAVLGFSMNFAPVLDVDTNPANPIIGDRAFSDDPEVVARLGVAYGAALEEEGVLSCGKHFPGHGDTLTDSHLALPKVDHPRTRLDAVELLPFRGAAKAGIAAIMTAHVICEGIDPNTPATLSPAVVTKVLREEIGFRGVVISDDLEMRAVRDHYEVEDAAVLAIAAGCDALLICSDEALQARAHQALVREAESSAAFRARCEEACRRVLAMRGRIRVARRATRGEILEIVGGSGSREVAEELAGLD